MNFKTRKKKSLRTERAHVLVVQRNDEKVASETVFLAWAICSEPGKLKTLPLRTHRDPAVPLVTLLVFLVSAEVHEHKLKLKPVPSTEAK